MRHAAAGLNPSIDIVSVNPGLWFEQWVIIKLWKRIKYKGIGEISYLRAKTGLEIDAIVEIDDKITPVEINGLIGQLFHMRVTFYLL